MENKQIEILILLCCFNVFFTVIIYSDFFLQKPFNSMRKNKYDKKLLHVNF